MNNPIVPTIEHSTNGLVVTSETIAYGVEGQHKNVLQLIRTYREDLNEFGTLESETRPFNGMDGKVQYREVFLLNEPQATLLMTYMRNMNRIREFKKALVKAFYEMAQRLSQPNELDEAKIVLRALELQDTKIKALSSKLEAIQPKADYVDTFVADEDLITFRTLASDLEVGERDLRDALIYSGWIYSQTKSRWSNSKEKLIPVTRYSAMADKKQYFQAVLNHDIPRFGGEVMHTLKVTAPGASAIARLLIRLASQYGSFEQSILPLETRYNEKKAS